ncbi:MAG TPA: type II secretion system inner membrane protein GspF [Myxococcota bacterium]|nr:type II secretion system inner membrane protein GspF [Myxococcota bacterium]HRY94822.1 type II secretion system inner membrane protein GspF [Myxococcota bacterium]HSA21761.1 type II secretion system inner membrane protein GspF [Myxococcota bacterium]
MPVYRYKGMNSAGKATAGIRDADSPRTLRALLRKEGIFLTEVALQGGATASSLAGEKVATGRRRGQKVSAQELAITTRQLATLLKAGVTLVESLAAMVDQSENDYLKLVLSQVKQRVNEGSSLADAMAQHPKVFPDLFCNMIRAGESSGALDVVLLRLAEFTEGQARMRTKIIGTMIYPAIMVLVGVVILAILFVVVIPKITQIFEDMKATLPLPTQMMLGLSKFIAGYWWAVIITLVGSVIALVRYKRTPNGRARWDRFKLRMPVFGSIVRMLAISRFARTLATLLKSGVPLIGALGIVRSIVNNQTMALAIDSARESITEGETIAQPLKRSGQFPPLVIHMIAVGERSGQLENMLENVASNYEYQAETRINALMSLLEPLMIVVMAGGVGFMVFSILLPIMQLNEFAH